MYQPGYSDIPAPLANLCRHDNYLITTVFLSGRIWRHPVQKCDDICCRQIIVLRLVCSMRIGIEKIYSRKGLWWVCKFEWQTE